MVDALKPYSRYRHSVETVDENGVLYTMDDTPFPYVALPDNGTYQVRGGEQWHEIADKVFDPLPYAVHLWWVLMDFQPVPLLDPTVPPAAGTLLVHPSVQTVLAKILNPDRRREQ